QSYVSVSSQSSAMSSGTGYAFGMYGPNTVGGESVWPKSFSASGAETLSDVSPTLNTGAADRFTLVGNPFAAPVRWSLMSKTNVGEYAQVYKTGEGWLVTDGTDTYDFNDTLAVWQGFMVNTVTDAAASLT